MPHGQDPRHLRILEPAACWERLRGGGVGRLAVIADGHPEIFPVNFAVDGGAIVFRTGSGTKAGSVGEVPDVAFEVDEIDLEGRCGWSVAVVGEARRVIDPAESRRLERLVPSWVRSGSAVFRIVPRSVSGRWLAADAADAVEFTQG